MNKLNYLLLSACILLALTIAISCSIDDQENDIGNNGSGCDISGYKTVKIGTQTWIAGNLDCEDAGGKCYDNNPANCTKYGRLYTWNEAKKACPSGWHLPDSAEWATLINYVENDKGCDSCAAKYLKATSGWKRHSGTTNLDSYGFRALPGGCYTNRGFEYAGEFGDWWTASEGGAGAWNLDMDYFTDEMNRGSFSKHNSISVRCVQDAH